MAEIPEFSHPQQFMLPEDGPYTTFSNETASGLELDYICIVKPGIVRYLHQRGVYLHAHLDAANAVINNDSGTVGYRFDMTSPYIKALIAICDDELSEPPKIPPGSSLAARKALFNGSFEQTEWFCIRRKRTRVKHSATIPGSYC